jgi:murein DD-endopeptidase MepM/ murein hydrolase activator NlpD
MNRRLFGGAAAALALACTPIRGGTAHAQASAPVLSFPVPGENGAKCFVENYFDHDAGPGAKDNRSGKLTYDGHDGTDIRLPNLAAMRKGVEVLAAADGVVRAVRDGMADVSIRETGAAAGKGREAGNGVVVDHGGGWQTQ